jgi:hypothetical protein
LADFMEHLGGDQPGFAETSTISDARSASRRREVDKRGPQTRE